MVLFVCAVCTLVGSAQGYIYFMNDTGQPGVMGAKASVSYENSEAIYDVLMTNHALYEMERAASVNLLLTDGVLDRSRLVNVGRLASEGVIADSGTIPVSWTLGDLLDASEAQENHSENSSKRSGKRIFVCEMANEGGYTYMTEAEFRAYLSRSGYHVSDSLSEEDASGSIYTGSEQISTEYRQYWTLWMPKIMDPVEGPLLQIYNENAELNGHLSDLISDLDQSLSMLRTAWEYVQNPDQFGDSSKTNFRYYIYQPLTGLTFTNDEQTNGLEAAEILRRVSGEECSVVMKDGTAESNGTLPHPLDDSSSIAEWLDNMSDAGFMPNQSELDTWMCAFSVDTDWGANDVFKETAALYQQYLQWFPVLYILFWGSMILIGLLLVMLTIGLGYNRDGEIVLNAFDRWKTGLAALAVLLPWLIFFAAGGDFLAESDLTHGQGYVAALLLISLPSAILFLIGYNSLCKRIRSHTLWNNSLLYYLGGKLKKLFFHMKKLSGNKALFLQLVIGLPLFVLVNIGLIGAGMIPMAFLLDIGFLLLIAGMMVQIQRIARIAEKIRDGENDARVDTRHMIGNILQLGEAVNHIGDGIQSAVDSRMKSERMKTELITNVSHDIKTPLTSIINYVDILKNELEQHPDSAADSDSASRVQEYLEVLDKKSQRLKDLMEDIIEASRISSGNIRIETSILDAGELIAQVEGEYLEKMQQNKLELVDDLGKEPVLVRGDGRHLWRVLSNLYQNAAKYAMSGSRVYVMLRSNGDVVTFTMKNISAVPLNITAEELMERFTRGDRSRSTEGSGLGLSIARSLTEAMEGSFDIYLDGDLFKVTVTLPAVS